MQVIVDIITSDAFGTASVFLVIGFIVNKLSSKKANQKLFKV